MEKFVNETLDGNEEAIKIGSKVPPGAINLSWFTANVISPANNINVVDLSETIQENTSLKNSLHSSSDDESVLVYADELGFLRTFDGQYTFGSDDFTVSNIFLNQVTESKAYERDSINPNSFVHYYYISRFFISAPGDGFYLLSINDYIDPERFKNLNLRVLDKNNEEYVDKNTGRKKYRFLLEPFITPTNKLRNEVPYRVIVLLDATDHDQIKLVYDKVECDEYGNMYNLNLNYTETINPVTFYEEIPEEAFVIDSNYSNDRKFSIKKLNQKYFDLTLSRQVDNGYQIVVPAKGLNDYRVFENFNWRLIARTKKNISFDQIEDDISQFTNGVITRTIKAGILYSSSMNQDSNSNIYPYIFSRLYNSPFNLNHYLFINPLNTNSNSQSEIEASINSADYWKVDIDSITSLDQFDVVAWSPTGTISANQVQKIRDFLLKNGTIILDLSNCSSSAAQSLSNQLIKNSSTVVGNYSEMNLNNPILDYTKNGGWTIDESIFEKEEYGLFGSNYIFNNNTYKSYEFFENSVTENNFLKIDSSTSPAKSIGTLIPFVSNTDALVRGNIIAVTFPLFKYCNSIYSISSPEQIVDLNFGSTSNNTQNENIYPGIVEGPFKLLYNAISFAAYCKLQSSREIRTNSSLYNFVSSWRSAWVMDRDALLESELPEFTNVNISSSIQIMGKDLDSSKSSIFEIYKSSLRDFLPDHQKDLVFGITNPDEIEFFIEVTNPDVRLTNANIITQSSFNLGENIPSAYTLFKISDNSSKSFAYTLKPSPKLEPPSGRGPYVVIDKTYSSSNDASLVSSLGNVLSSFKSYPFALNTTYSYLNTSDKPSVFSFSGLANFKMLFEGSYTRELTVDGGTSTSTTLVNVTAPCLEFKSAIDDLDLLREEGSSNPNNTYLYSGDIDIHKDPRLWRSGSPTHEYVKYIQYTMSTIGGQICVVDGIFGPQTAGAVKNFQIANNQRYLDGTVDSETKSYMAFAWKNLKSSNITRFNYLRTSTTTNANLSAVTKYIDAAANAGTTSTINSKSYKKITFSGFSGPSQSFDILFFKIPNNLEKLNKIVIEADLNSIWQNFTIAHYGYSSTFKSNIFDTNVRALNLSVSNGKIQIILDSNQGVDPTGFRYMWISIVGGPISNFGYAEGFSIKSITAFGKISQTTIIDNPDITNIQTGTVYALANVKLNLQFSDVSVQNSPSYNFSTSFPQRASAYIESLQIGYPNESGGMDGPLDQTGDNPVNITLEESIYLDDIDDYYFENNAYKFNFGQTENLKSINLETFSIQSLIGDGVTLSVNNTPSPVETIISNPTTTTSSIVAQTSSVYYEDSEYVTVSTDISENYRLKTIDGYLYPESRNTVTVNDGILLICDSSGNSIGLPTADEINSEYLSSPSILAPETDLRYGYFVLNNQEPVDNGLIYGFYDNSQKEFLGKIISYTDVITRGIQNIFPAVCAIDADGNTANRNEFIGPTVSTTFVPVNSPLKLLAPVYSLKLKRASSIRVNPIDSNLDKFDAWELPVSSGTFWKNINVSLTRPWSGWINSYAGQTLKAYYTTLDQIPINWSGIFGKGFYDVRDELPVLLDDRTIQLRRVPLANFNYKTNYIGSRVGILKPPLQIFIKSSELSDWELLDEQLIRDVNCKTGIIKFKTRIIPNNKNLIKVSYTTSDKSNLIKHINGNPIPLNPLLNSDLIDFDSPLYIYINPKEIYKQNLDPNLNLNIINLEKIEEYTFDSVVNFTYDSTLFDKSSSNYDPFALLIAIIYVNNNPYRQKPNLIDTRSRGGGLKVDIPSSDLLDAIPNVLSYWDVYPPSGEAYARGGYVIIRIPEEVKDHFVDENEIYNIITNNLTAGIAYDLQDMNGNNWT